MVERIAYRRRTPAGERQEITRALRDAFWKSGAGGFALIIVPSLDLVVLNGDEAKILLQLSYNSMTDIRCTVGILAK